ncbi:MAG: hypothetical protein AVDCRST_MAG19-2330 [uncultured Thermomicrobiales bacterium]|uniref:Solute-binding protein family 5 domain-containing protein n=1 Tax=uncultured Thermomicrobiales bacterium TaxID=1645740 RepID=A0A6J4V6D4_9BACT|nr:MAG: hypothetical protein AVDCRST_MAG19-2330 [uncultured Thermomicrobiales bacterium]
METMVNRSVSRRTAIKAGLAGAAGVAAMARGQELVRAMAAQGAPGGRLVIGKILDLYTYDPHLSASQVSWEVQAMVYESLVFLGDNFELLPGLAERWEQPDDRTYVFTLRPGVTFHNGREMTADDVVFSLERVRDHPESWWNVKLGYTVDPDPAVAAADATAEALGTPVTANKIGLTFAATGPNQITATLSEPYAPFLQALTATTCSIVPGAEVASGDLDLGTTMVGTGPFKVTEHREDQSWTLARHDGYWQSGQPVVGEVVWQVIPDETARVASLRTGEIQAAMFDNPAMLDVMRSDPNVTPVEQVTTNYYILFVNANRPELEDPRVRQAISAGIDRAQIAQAALFGRGEASGPIAAGFGELATPLEDVPFYTRDVERAKALLAEAGQGGGLSLPLIVTPDIPLTVPMAEIVKEQLAEVGIEVEILQRDFATFVNEYNVEGTAHLAISWWAGYSDPYLILIDAVSTKSFGPVIGQTDTAIDAQLGRVARETDLAARQTALQELELAIANQGSFQPLVTRNNFMAYRNDLLGEIRVANADGYGLPLWHRVQEVTPTA